MIEIRGFSESSQRLSLSSSSKKIIFKPGRYPGKRCGVSKQQFGFLVRNFYEEIKKEYDVLILVDTEEEVFWGAPAGPGTLFSGYLDSIKKVAIQSASAVVSFEWKSVELAKQSGVPSFLVALDRDTHLKAELSKIPHVSLDDSIDLKFWKKEFIKAINVRNEQAASASFSIGRSGETLNICSISDQHYLPSLMGLIENVLSVDRGNICFHVLAFDDVVYNTLDKQYPAQDVKLYRLDDLYSSGEVARISSRTIAEQSFTCKARLLSTVLELVQGPLFYIDADLYFFRSPRHLIHDLADNSVLLFPHWNDVLANFRLHGIYNAGMMVVAPGSEEFLAYWSNLCLYKCKRDPKKGYFVDQGFLDMAPLYFDRVGIYRKGEHNIGAWNVRSLYNQDLNLGSFHAAHPDDLGIFEVKAAWDQLVSFFASVKQPQKMQNFYYRTLLQQKNHWNGLASILFGYHTIKNRLGLRKLRLSPYLVERSLRGNGYRVMKAIGKLYGLIRKAKNKIMPNSPPLEEEKTSEFWVPMQQSLLSEMHSRPVIEEVGELSPERLIEKYKNTPYWPVPQGWTIEEVPPIHHQ